MLTLGIVNTYDKIKVLDAHYRAIARAAPICHAFGFHLALYDFPFKMTAEELVSFVMEKTTIGESGSYLRTLYEKSHLSVADLPKKGFPSQFGDVVITTSKPDPKRKVLPAEIAEEALRNRSFLFLVGLGHKGLPKELFERGKYQLDITSKGLSLETCTAIGAIPAHLSGLMEILEIKKRA
ncbi:Uncharacterized protein conserved in archaea (DUF531) [Methanosarcina siciliae C2J]|uniref:Uncharacterized protein conserved in archaea (DUF531) n=4 Tax=Methanosarcina siciliae TaxID=38027 RepID=A0A0E3P9W2_9EURY|nr:DUF531 domain-containing protein [Methanosarcina siciliae]AKB26916.1 Uncharacterized protein conserved in archaea (DUF531) [Methanosarcina siciliae T4/M]AKB30883.1 Uncharacterized protein conserved in archaea (DUF531) [Methanosarcina siciliae HI350]AKB34814.1 Uncharacterized protein conserved in archaea (DUF531) [Methanosarcina siciliae C2J]